MSRTLIFTICLLVTSNLAFGQLPGGIGLYSDTYGTDCNLVSTNDSLLVHCVHVNTSGATACQFRIEVTGAPLTHVGDTSPFPLFIGNSQDGIAIGYGLCLNSPIHVLTITYFGVPSPCDMIKVVEDPRASPPGIYMTDCTTPVPELLTAMGGTAYINDDGSCYCNVPVEETSWGQIKKLYR